MLSLMYRYSVDTLGSIISPVTIVVLYLFKDQFEINKLVRSHAFRGLLSPSLAFAALPWPS